MDNILIEWLTKMKLDSEIKEIILKIDNNIFVKAGERRLGKYSEMRISYGPSNSKKNSNIILFPKKGLNLIRLQIKLETYNEINSEICKTQFTLPSIKEHSHRFIEKEIKSSDEINDELIEFLAKGVNNII
jgi:hypothetical protein